MDEGGLMSREQLMTFGGEKSKFFRDTGPEMIPMLQHVVPHLCASWYGADSVDILKIDKNREHTKEEYGKGHTREEYGVTEREISSGEGGGNFGPNIIYMECMNIKENIEKKPLSVVVLMEIGTIG